MALNITVLGSSSGFPTAARYSPSIHLNCGSRNILLDCGEGASGHMVRLGLKVSDIQTVLISHMHADHIGGLVQLAQTWQIGQWEGYTPKDYRPVLVMPAEGVEPLKALFDAAYLMPEVIAPMVLRYVGVPWPSGPSDNPPENASDTVSPVFVDSEVQIRAIHNSHLSRFPARIQGFAERYPNNRCQALSYSIGFAGGERVIYSGDVGNIRELDPLMSDGADLLIVELAHHGSESLMEYLLKWRRGIGAVLINHIGPRYDDKGKEVEETAKRHGLDNVFMGYDGFRLTL